MDCYYTIHTNTTVKLQGLNHVDEDKGALYGGHKVLLSFRQHGSCLVIILKISSLKITWI